MAGDWIKMRGGLFSSPKLIAMGRELHASKPFREWMTPGGSGGMNGQIVSDHALRCVTGALLCVTWSWSREYGHELQNGDCLLPHISLDDLDGIAGAPGVGHAMNAVGWALEAADSSGVILPNFFSEHNVPLTNAEKQKAYRQRKLSHHSVTEALPTRGNKTVTREEKRREEKKEEREKRENAPTLGNEDWEARVHFREGFNAPEVRASLRNWMNHLAARGSILDWALTATEAMRRYADPAEFLEAVQFAIGNNRDYLGRGFAKQETKQESPQYDYADGYPVPGVGNATGPRTRPPPKGR
jgi:hypothetical protein